MIKVGDFVKIKSFEDMNACCPDTLWLRTKRAQYAGVRAKVIRVVYDRGSCENMYTLCKPTGQFSWYSFTLTKEDR